MAGDYSTWLWTGSDANAVLAYKDNKSRSPSTMSKYYRVKQDTFLWDKGAILKLNESLGESGGYTAISDLWDVTENVDNEFVTDEVIENTPDWFERVYEISVLGKAKYLTKEAAKAAHDKLYDDKKGE